MCINSLILVHIIRITRTVFRNWYFSDMHGETWTPRLTTKLYRVRYKICFITYFYNIVLKHTFLTCFYSNLFYSIAIYFLFNIVLFDRFMFGCFVLLMWCLFIGSIKFALSFLLSGPNFFQTTYSCLSSFILLFNIHNLTLS